MKNIKKMSIMILMMVFITIGVIVSYAENVDDNMPKPDYVNLGSDGEVTWDISGEGINGVSYLYKKFQIKLQKRYLDAVKNEYDWKDYGSIKTISITENTPSEYCGSVEVGTPGYYRALVRAYSTDGVYGPWSEPSSDAAFDSATTNISISDGSSVASNFGPGTVYGGSTGMQAQNPYQNYGNASNIIGVNGQYITSAGQGSAYIYDNSYKNNIAYQGQSTTNVGVGPGINNGATNDTYAPGPGTNTQVVTGIKNDVVTSPIYNGADIKSTNQIIQTGPSQSGNGTQGGQSWSMEVGWHIDTNGLYYYYQGNGVYLRNQWYLIENNYYRFNEQGYALINKWFKDPSNGAWYYMGDDGKMLTGWQYITGIWYYLNPERGTNYGVMYSDCSVNIGGKYYAFNSEGTCILNGYYNGHYYGADGSRQN